MSEVAVTGGTSRSAPGAGIAHTHVAMRGVRRSFGGLLVLDDVSYVRDSPGIVGLLGANGSGKTTLLRILAQLTTPDGGAIQIAGREVERGDDPVARRLVGWAPHTPLAWLDETVRSNLVYAARLAGDDRRAASERAQLALDRWQAQEVADTPVRRLSRGWQQRYALARADLFEPPVLLLDEPTTGLDSAARGALDLAMETWRVDRLVLVATHERTWIAGRTDTLLELDRGRLV